MSGLDSQKGEKRMSKNIIILVVILAASAAFGAVYSDGIYAQNSDNYYVANASDIVDITAKSGKAVDVVYREKADVPSPDLSQALADVASNFSVDVDAQQQENKPVTAVTVNANYSITKGPVYVQYSHSRSYARTVDEFIPSANTDFQGTVNNRITFGVSFAPSMPQQQTSNNLAGNSNPVNNVQATTAPAAIVRSSSVN
jgi:hypothetical protein